MLNTLTAAAALLVFSTGFALAQGAEKAAPAPVPTPAATAPVVTPAAAPAKLPDGCTFMPIKQKKIAKNRPNIDVTFSGSGGADVANFKACNPEEVVKRGESNAIGISNSPTRGVRLTIKTKEGSAVIGVPTTLKNGDAQQVYCDIDKEKKAITFTYYKLTWNDGLPEAIDLADKTEELNPGDAEMHKQGCLAAAPPDIRAQLPG